MKRLKVKQQGILEDFLPIIIFVITVSVLLISYIHYNNAVNQKSTLNTVSRNCLLKMETTGYMTTEIYESFRDKLHQLGYKGNALGGEITWNNFQNTDKALYTTITDVGYGNEICLTFTVYTKNTLLATSVDENGNPDFDLMAPKFESKYVPISITYYSTSKE